MREIKFRAWDKENDRMLFPDDADDILFEITIDGIKTIDLNGNEDPYAGLPCLDTVVMQYTGLKDKNGIDIYDGDIFWSDHSGEYTYVEYQEGAFYIIHTVTSEKTLLSKEHGDWIIRGNIYENPELLEREAE